MKVVILENSSIHILSLRACIYKARNKFHLTIAFQTQRANGGQFELEMTDSWCICTELFLKEIKTSLLQLQ